MTSSWRRFTDQQLVGEDVLVKSTVDDAGSLMGTDEANRLFVAYDQGPRAAGELPAAGDRVDLTGVVRPADCPTACRRVPTATR